jgi:hypothetical protein
MPYGGANPAAKGRHGDTELGHLQRGEIILPPDFPQQRPDLYAEIAEFLGNDIGRRTVGGGDDAINPDTGYPEFFAPGGAFGAMGFSPGAYGGGGPRGSQSVLSSILDTRMRPIPAVRRTTKPVPAITQNVPPAEPPAVSVAPPPPPPRPYSLPDTTGYPGTGDPLTAQLVDQPESRVADLTRSLDDPVTTDYSYLNELIALDKAAADANVPPPVRHGVPGDTDSPELKAFFDRIAQADAINLNNYYDDSLGQRDREFDMDRYKATLYGDPDEGGIGLTPGELNQYNLTTKHFMPEIFGESLGWHDKYGVLQSNAEIANMSLPEFNSFYSGMGGPEGDPESPFGMAVLGGKDLFSAISNPLQFAISKMLMSAATGEDISLGPFNTGINFGLGEPGEGIFGGEGGVGGILGGWLSGLDADSLSIFGPSIATGAGLNRGGGPGAPSPAAGAPAPPSSAQLLEQLLAGTATPEQREAATTAALNRLSAQTGQNPFTLPGGGLDEPQFADVISSGLARQNEQLVDPVSFGRLSDVFGDENLLKNILTEETGIRREGFTSDLESAFPGDAFGEIDDNIINSIIEERIGPARQQVSNFAARNLSAPGGTGANEFLRQQEETARGRLGEIGGNVQSLNQLGVNAIRDVARSGIRDFELGAGFDVAPFAEQRQSLIGERTGTFGEDVRTQLGSEPLFDVSGALSAGSRAGGVVSGQPQGGEGLLDVIAERELAGRTDRRGLQRSGSGAF